MNPSLVGSCKQVKQSSGSEVTTTDSAKNSIKAVSISSQTFETSRSCKVNECSTDILVLKYEEVADAIFLHPHGLYITKLFRVDQSVYDQVMLNKSRQ